MKNSFSNTAGKMKNIVSMNTPYMLVITRGCSLNGWIKNENMKLKVLGLHLVRDGWLHHGTLISSSQLKIPTSNVRRVQAL